MYIVHTHTFYWCYNKHVCCGQNHCTMNCEKRERGRRRRRRRRRRKSDGGREGGLENERECVCGMGVSVQVSTAIESGPPICSPIHYMYTRATYNCRNTYQTSTSTSRPIALKPTCMPPSGSSLSTPPSSLCPLSSEYWTSTSVR